MLAEADPPPAIPPAILAYQPVTFLERGVAVPFTTPALQGARARPAERGGTEIIVRNPAGGRGTYILPWGGVCQLCSPTVHDSLLNQRVAALQGVTPEAIRRISREVAEDGLAGRAASSTAVAEAEAERQDRLMANYLLLVALIEQVEPRALSGFAEAAASPEILKERARRVIARLAPQLGATGEAIADALEALAGHFAAIGVRAQPQSKPPRLVRVLEAVQTLAAQMAAWKQENDDETADAAELVGAAAELTLACAGRVLADAHALQADMPGLLRRFQAAPEKTVALIGRPAWVLDGWEQICLAWQQAGTLRARRAALAGLAAMAPMLPREAGEWAGTPVIEDLPGWRFRKTVRLLEDWRTGSTLDLIAAGERLRALAL